MMKTSVKRTFEETRRTHVKICQVQLVSGPCLPRKAVEDETLAPAIGGVVRHQYRDASGFQGTPLPHKIMIM